MNRNGEAKLISGSEEPLTKPMLKEMLREIGLFQGDLVLVHASLSRLGWIVGGAQTVLEALLETLRDDGTLVMPGFSSQLSDPTHWERPPVPAQWHEAIANNMPLFDPERTPTRGLSTLNELFRGLSATKRSQHPIDSFLALGLLADEITRTHPLSPTFGEGGPLGELYRGDAKVLFLGSGFDTCTSFHLAEYENPNAAWGKVRYPTSRRDGVTQWTTVKELSFQEGLFARIGADMEADGGLIERRGPVRLFAMRYAVDYAKGWFKRGESDQ